MKDKQQANFTFKNLQPILYLKNFNQMIEYQTRNNLTQSKKHGLKIVSLSKFPLPKDYESMQGIFQNANKKKIIENQSKLNREEQQQELFMKNHNNFMRKVLQRFIKHNESRQNTYQKQKDFYKIDFKNHYRSKSEPKIDFDRKENKQNQKILEVQRSEPLATLGSQIEEQFTKNQSTEKFSPLPKLSPLKKKEKIFIRKEKKMQQLLVNRKLKMPNPESYSSAKRKNTAESKNEQYFDLKQSIVNLQIKQAKKQSFFTKRVDQQIDEIERKMTIQMHAINYFSIWNEAQSKDQSKKQNGYNKEYQSNNVDNSRIDCAFKCQLKKS